MMKQRLIIRLDDAAEKMNIKKWDMMEQMLDKYGIKPLVGVIPDCKDPMMDKYEENPEFWNKVHRWIDKGWSIAMHGYQHVYDSKDGGVNPVNHFSEFAGHPVEIQRKRIKKGYDLLRQKRVIANIFFAPGHTFDENTIKALMLETDIRIISDTIAGDAYRKDGMVYVPVQSGRFRKLPFRTVTYCLHPNTMIDESMMELDTFIKQNSKLFVSIEDVTQTNRSYDVIDKMLSRVYYAKR